MSAEPRQWVDVEGAVREWARDNVPSVDRRVFFGPNGQEPQIVLFRLGGPDDRCLIQCDVWAGEKGTADGTKAAAAAIASELATAADVLSRYEFGGVRLLGALVESVRWLPDEETDTPRYVIDLLVTATSA